MQEIIDKKLYNYLNNILNLLFEEKLSSINIIDSFILFIRINITNMKEYLSCHE